MQNKNQNKSQSSIQSFIQSYLNMQKTSPIKFIKYIPFCIKYKLNIDIFRAFVKKIDNQENFEEFYAEIENLGNFAGKLPLLLSLVSEQNCQFFIEKEIFGEVQSMDIEQESAIGIQRVISCCLINQNLFNVPQEFLNKLDEKYLKFIYLCQNQITSIEGANFLEAEVVDLDDNLLVEVDVAKVNFGQQLTLLILSNNMIINFQGAQTLQNLNILDLSQNKLEEFGDLSSLLNLEVIYLQKNRIKEINWKLFPQGLKQLYLDSNHIKKFETEGMPGGIEVISVCYNKISEIVGEISDKIANNVDLYINFQNNDLNLKNANFKKINRLDISCNQHENGPVLFEKLEIDLKVKQIDISEVQFADQVFDLGKYNKLAEFRAQKIDLRDLKQLQLSQNGELETVDISRNQLRQLQFSAGDLQINENIKQLQCFWNQIQDISGIQYLKNLLTLNLQYNQITSIFGVVWPEFLRSLNLSHNRIKSIEGSKFNDKIKELFLQFNQIEFLNDVYFGNELIYLNLKKNNLGSIQVNFPETLAKIVFDEEELFNITFQHTFQQNLQQNLQQNQQQNQHQNQQFQLQYQIDDNEMKFLLKFFDVDELMKLFGNPSINFDNLFYCLKKMKLEAQTILNLFVEQSFSFNYVKNNYI